MGAGTNYFILMTEYMDLFYDKSDVVEDLRPYLKLLNADQDIEQMKERLMDRVSQHEEMENETEQAPGKAKMTTAPISLRVIRWRFVSYKINRILGVNTLNSEEEKIYLVNKLFSCFLQAMEYHAQAASNSGVGVNHSQHISPNEGLTDLDKKNAEEILLIAVETLYEVK